MLTLNYPYRNKKIDFTLLALDVSEFEASKTPIENGHFREAVFSVFFTMSFDV